MKWGLPKINNQKHTQTSDGQFVSINIFALIFGLILSSSQVSICLRAGQYIVFNQLISIYS